MNEKGGGVWTIDFLPMTTLNTWLDLLAGELNPVWQHVIGFFVTSMSRHERILCLTCDNEFNADEGNWPAMLVALTAGHEQSVGEQCVANGLCRTCASRGMDEIRRNAFEKYKSSLFGDGCRELDIHPTAGQA
jgi:hypothetical protein